jgi:hypothetical protein
LLTEAVVTGTTNLLVTGLAAADLIGYVEAGVATPVRDTTDLLTALDGPRDAAARASDREAFIADHFGPDGASQRIAEDLLSWMS